MENEQVVQPAAVVSPEADSLDSYRASREAKPAKEPAKETAPSQTPAPVATGSDDELAADATPEQIERKKKLGGFQKTISRQNDELLELRRQLAAAGTPPATAVKPAAAAAAPAAAAVPDYEKIAAKPKIEDAADLTEFTEKLANWTADRRDWLKDQKTQADTAQAAATSLADGWKTKTTAFKSEHDDYDAVLAGVDHVQLSPAHQQIFLESENGVALAYQLAQDPEQLQKIAAMTPLQAARAIGILEASFIPSAEAEEAPQPETKVSAAPPPFKSVNGATTRSTPNIATLSLDDYRKGRESGRIQ